jgi:hypothetical protein
MSKICLSNLPGLKKIAHIHTQTSEVIGRIGNSLDQLAPTGAKTNGVLFVIRSYLKNVDQGSWSATHSGGPWALRRIFEITSIVIDCTWIGAN